MPQSDTRALPPEYESSCCEWQECVYEAVAVRDTSWGDLLVCTEHAQAPLSDDEPLRQKTDDGDRDSRT
jgi:hypothetical protein